MSRNKRYIVNKSSKKVAIGTLFIVFILIILPFILMISKNSVARFWGYTISCTSIPIIMLILGLCFIILHGNKDIKLMRRIKTKIIGILFSAFSLFLIIELLPNYYKDVPVIINSDYSSYEGKLTKFHISKGRSISTNFTIGDKEFKVDGVYSSNFLVVGKVYRVEYLPNSKFVMSLEARIVK